MNLIQHAQNLINQAKANGQIPLVLAMNQSTMEMVRREMLASQQEQRSWFENLRRKLSRKQPDPAVLKELCGLPVTLVPLPDGIIGLQTAQFRPGGAQQSQEQQTEPMAEFREKMKAKQESADAAPTLADLAKGNDISPSAIIIKSMENIDDIKHVIVIRVHHNNDVDLCVSCDHFQAQGIVQRAQYYLATRD